MRMMAKSIVVMGAILVLAAMATAGEAPWFDMQNCAVCKNLTTVPGLMQHFTKWEHYKTADGLLNLSVVDKDYVPAYLKAQAAMDSVTAAMKAGGPMPHLCGSCMAYGEIMQGGAKYEKFQSDNIFMSSLTSDKPEVAAKIHTWVDRTQAEMAKMMQAPPPQQKQEEKKGN